VSILAVGTTAFDSVETPFGSAECVLGGSATYLTLAARYFAEDVRLVGVVGHDFPDEYVQVFKDRGVDLEGLTVDETKETFFWKGRYHEDLSIGERDTLETRLGVVETFDPTLPERYRDSRIVALGNLDPTIQRRVLEQVERPELVICDTMNFWMENALDSLRETLPLVDCLVINDTEARQLSEEPNLIRAAAVVRDMGPEMLIIKKGEHGALFFDDEGVFSVPAFPMENVHDPTGAGDTFAGGLAGFLSAQKALTRENVKRGIVYGSALASFVIEAFGPERLLDLSDEAIHERARAFRQLSAIPDLEPLYS
jgi:sugar/nucleoside kinase (ribokinase family)